VRDMVTTVRHDYYHNRLSFRFTLSLIFLSLSLSLSLFLCRVQANPGHDVEARYHEELVESLSIFTSEVLRIRRQHVFHDSPRIRTRVRYTWNPSSLRLNLRDWIYYTFAKVTSTLTGNAIKREDVDGAYLKSY